MKISEMIKAYGGMIIGKTDYWHPDVHFNKNINTENMGPYYLDMRLKHTYIEKKDAEGIPLLEYDGEYCYFPTTVAQYALGNFDMYIETKNEEFFKICENCAEWFVKTISELNGVYGYRNDVDKGIYRMKKPWFSALSQAQAMSVLARCYSVNHKKEYADTCKKLLKSFETSAENGGVLAKLDGSDFYEEYPAKIHTYVLNGFIFSLWGLLDFYIVSKDEEAKKLYQNGEATLEKNLYRYNVGHILHWSYYDLYPFKIKDITSIYYHKLHIEQLKAMYELTGCTEYKKYYEKWERARKNIFIYVYATMYKIIHKLSVRKLSSYVPSIK